MKINTIFTCLKKAVQKADIKPEKVCLVSDFLHQPEISQYLGYDLFHITRGRTIPFSTGMKLGNPKLKVIALVGDLLTLGGNHFLHAGRRNMDITVICINNFIYPKINGQKTPAYFTEFTPYAPFERPVNIPHLARSSLAVFVSRWTAKHEKELTDSISTALGKSGFSAIEVISPGTCYFAGIPEVKNREKLLDFYYRNSEIDHSAKTDTLEISADNKIVAGNFFEQERPTYIDSYNHQLSKTLGEKFVPYG
ncbi:MAG: 2-oxoacid:ferredoxin oxidoreductase subunit beta [Candidatus Cloacimonetes bacterium]|nr:2-oxoacid:ferredoxin oxidoreductase subunit beta [Candidatus Cloacimonadota bacterium]